MSKLVPGGLLLLLSTAAAQAPNPGTETYQYEAEWRLIRAGTAVLSTGGPQYNELRLTSQGLVDKLIHIDDRYRAEYGPNYCATTLNMDAREGRRHRTTQVSFDAGRKRGSYLEKDVVKNTIVRQQELDIPPCVQDVLGALALLRQASVQPGQSWTAPVSDGKKVITAKVDCLGREQIKTKAGEFAAVKYEAHLFNGILYGRKGRLFLWISDDARRIPVQIRIQLPFYIGTVTLQLEKFIRS